MFFLSIEEGRPLFLPCVTAMPGAFVSVYLDDPPSNPLSICEAFVYTDQGKHISNYLVLTTNFKQRTDNLNAAANKLEETIINKISQ